MWKQISSPASSWKRLTSVLALVTGVQVYAYGQTTYEVTLAVNQAPKLVANAGPDILAPVAVLQLGALPVATGGTPPFFISWSPESFLSDVSASNPLVAIEEDVDVTYTLSVTDSKGCSAQDEVQVRLVVTGVATERSDVSVFPNPTSSILNIESTKRIENVRLINHQGVVVYSFANPARRLEIPLQFLSQGMYLLQFEINGVQVVRRVNIVR